MAFNAFFTSVFNTDDVLEDCDLGDDKLPADCTSLRFAAAAGCT